MRIQCTKELLNLMRKEPVDLPAGEQEDLRAGHEAQGVHRLPQKRKGDPGLHSIYTLHSGATLYDSIGAYTGDHHTEIISIVDKHGYQKLMDYIIRVDPDAFVTVYNVSSMRYRLKPKGGAAADVQH